MTDFDRSTWQTPPAVIEAAGLAMGGISLDPATAPDNPTQALRFFAPGTRAGDFQDFAESCGPDALAAEWPDGDSLWLNPPWGRGRPITPWATRAGAWVDAQPHRRGLLLLPTSLNAAWFHLLWDRRYGGLVPRVFAPSRRLAFLHPETRKPAVRPDFDAILLALGLTDAMRGRLRRELLARGVGGRWL